MRWDDERNESQSIRDSSFSASRYDTTRQGEGSEKGAMGDDATRQTASVWRLVMVNGKGEEEERRRERT
jgi:hypothetical protein